MSLKFEPYEVIKDLYMKKVKATDEKDVKTLEFLKKVYPELFDNTFLLGLLKEAFIRMEKIDKNKLN